MPNYLLLSDSWKHKNINRQSILLIKCVKLPVLCSKTVLLHLIDQFSKFVCLLISICSQLPDYVKEFAISIYSDVNCLHFMAENGTICSEFPVHEFQKVEILCRMDG